MKFKFALIAAVALSLGASAMAQTKWDLPAAYPATNFHTVNLQQFADDVEKASGGKLKITVHANASLFKAPEIKRAVQGGQVTWCNRAHSTPECSLKIRSMPKPCISMACCRTIRWVP